MLNTINKGDTRRYERSRCWRPRSTRLFSFPTRGAVRSIDIWYYWNFPVQYCKYYIITQQCLRAPELYYTSYITGLKYYKLPNKCFNHQILFILLNTLGDWRPQDTNAPTHPPAAGDFKFEGLVPLGVEVFVDDGRAFLPPADSNGHERIGRIRAEVSHHQLAGLVRALAHERAYSSTVQYKTVHYSTVQYITVRYIYVRRIRFDLIGLISAHLLGCCNQPSP